MLLSALLVLEGGAWVEWHSVPGAYGVERLVVEIVLAFLFAVGLFNQVRDCGDED